MRPSARVAALTVLTASVAACRPFAVAPPTPTGPPAPPTFAAPAFTQPPPPTQLPPSQTTGRSPVAFPTTTRESDTRVVNANPMTLLLDLSDLPAGEYKAWPPINDMGSSQPELMQGWVDGGTASFQSISSPDGVSAGVDDTVALYLTAEAARTALEERSFCKTADPIWRVELVDPDLLIGDATVACTSKSERMGGGYYVYYYVEFTRRNVYHKVLGSCRECVQAAARQLLARVDGAPLAAEVTWLDPY